jgi:anti-anti-sigma factor
MVSSRPGAQPGCGARPVLHDDGTLRITQGPGPGLVLAGEIDEDTYPALEAVLTGLAAGAADLDLDLSGVAYCDLAGLRAMIRLADAQAGGRRVILRNLPPGLRTVLEVVGWDSTPGVVIDPPAVGCPR